MKIKLEQILILVFALLIILGFNTEIKADEWNKELVGSVSNAHRAVIGDGRNDGVNRLYVGTRAGKISEFTFNPESTPYPWDEIECVFPSSSGFDPSISWIKIDQARNDGINRIYASRMDGQNFEFFYNLDTQEWETVVFDDDTSTGQYDSPYGLIIGNVRNDGVNRIITHGGYNYVNEMTWNENWSRERILNQDYCLYPGDYGDARNDGINRIYLPDYSPTATRIFEYYWNSVSNSYQYNFISFGNLGFERLVLGDARNDGVTRLYASQGIGTGTGGDASIIEMEYNGSSWDQNDIHEAYSSDYMRFEMVIGKTHSDDRNRLYSTGRRGALVEHEYSDDSWSESEIDVVSGATSTVFVGDARNDGINRVYITGTGGGGRIFEYTHTTQTGIGNNNNDESAIKNYELKQNYPNPFNPLTRINYELRISNYELAEIVVYNAMGQEVWSSPITDHVSNSNFTSENSLRVTGSILFDGSKFNSGIYYYSLIIDGKKIDTKSMILIK